MNEGLALTAGETARVLGISRQRLYKLRRNRPDFPKPVSDLWPGQKPLWPREAVLRWWRAQVKRAQGGRNVRLPMVPESGDDAGVIHRRCGSVGAEGDGRDSL